MTTRPFRLIRTANLLHEFRRNGRRMVHRCKGINASQGRALGEARQVFLSHLIVMESAADCKRAILPSKFPVQDSLPSAFRSEKINFNAAKSPTRQACGCPPGPHFFELS